MTTPGSAGINPHEGHSHEGHEPNQTDRLPPSAFTVLISGDDAAVLSVMVRLFRHWGFRVIGTPSSSETIAICQQQANSLVISDICKPGISGLEMFRRIRSSDVSRHIPFVFVTARCLDKAQALALGANDFLCKPVEIHEFTEMVRRVLPVALEET